MKYPKKDGELSNESDSLHDLRVKEVPKEVQKEHYCSKQETRSAYSKHDVEMY